MAMISEKENKRISKFLSFVLRHQPEFIGLNLDENGWADVNDLLNKMNSNGFQVTNELLDHIVATNNKKRFAFDDNKSKIRASQGHSIDVELGLKEMTPPEFLYHGTAEKSVESILASGLEKRDRQHVHLSSDKITAKAVGGRHGQPKIFIVAASQMKEDGFAFYLSENNVWLTDNVPARYLKLLEEG
jgi:putative RNA 2'-phosphotransferase